MHELGLVFYIIKDVEKIAQENKASKVSSVTIQIGEVSGVIDSYLLDCWKWAIQKTTYLQEAKLVIEPIKAISICEDCKEEYETVKYAKICPKCHSEHTHLVKGTEMMIKEIEAQ